MLKVVVAVIVLIVLLGWLGLLVRPQPFPPYPERTPELSTIPVPGGLPAPVDRFYRTVYGSEVPVIETVVFTGRATMSFQIPMPARFVLCTTPGATIATISGDVVRLAHHEGERATWMGPAISRRPSAPLRRSQLNQGANLALGPKEPFPLPLLTDRARWGRWTRKRRSVRALRGRERELVVRFDPTTGLMTMMESCATATRAT